MGRYSLNHKDNKQKLLQLFEYSF